MIIDGNKYTVGADPELFMGLNGEFISAHNTIKGDKLNPFLVNKGGVQVDGMALEFNIDPASSEEEFIDNIVSVKATLKDMIGDMDFLETASVMFDEDFIKDIPVVNKVLGCSPDYNAWSFEENATPNSDLMMRTAGGHAHIGGFFSENEFDYTHYLKGARLSRILDSTVGVYSILWDKDDKRREMYGKAGSFRPKTYGMEYRSLSNMWVFNEKLMSFVYQGIEEALRLFHTEYEPDPMFRKIIDNSDRGNKFFQDNQVVEKWGFNYV